MLKETRPPPPGLGSCRLLTHLSRPTLLARDPIKEGDGYLGIRLRADASLSRVRLPRQINIGVGGAGNAAAIFETMAWRDWGLSM